VRQHGIILNEL
ncbi:Nitrogen fixation transcriptional regulator protein, NifA, partial CDS, partial [Neorhizobium galegae bv. orientalis]